MDKLQTIILSQEYGALSERRLGMFQKDRILAPFSTLFLFNTRTKYYPNSSVHLEKVKQQQQRNFKLCLTNCLFCYILMVKFGV